MSYQCTVEQCISYQCMGRTVYVISVHGWNSVCHISARYNNVCHISAWVEQCMSYQCMGRTMCVISMHG